MEEQDLVHALKTNACSSPSQLLVLTLDKKWEAINKYDDIIWKVRVGYLAILYTSLVFLTGMENMGNLGILAMNNAVSLSVFFIILGFSISSFLVDIAYLSKRTRVIVIRDMLIDLVYDPEYKVKGNPHRFLHVSAELHLKKHFRHAHREYKEKFRWNFWRIVLPIYVTTPLLAIIIFFVYRHFMMRA